MLNTVAPDQAPAAALDRLSVAADTVLQPDVAARAIRVLSAHAQHLERELDALMTASVNVPSHVADLFKHMKVHGFVLAYVGTDMVDAAQALVGRPHAYLLGAQILGMGHELPADLLDGLRRVARCAGLIDGRHV